MRLLRSTSFLFALVAIALAVWTSQAGAGEIASITAEGLHARLQEKREKPLIVDVREPEEFNGGHIAGALLAPLAGVADSMERVPRDREIVLVCRSGRRSGKAYEVLAARGFSSLRNMEGGMLAWEKLGYPTVK
jgi:rhodanese-related sulfurtransferase